MLYHGAVSIGTLNLFFFLQYWEKDRGKLNDDVWRGFAFVHIRRLYAHL